MDDIIESANKTRASPEEDMFDSIVMAEERFHEEGFRQGFSAGQIAGEEEGFRMGQDQGRQIGSELGFYLGFVSTWQQLVKKDPEVTKPKTAKALDTLHSLLTSFRLDDVTHETYWDEFKKIRDKFKQVASMLNVTLEATSETTQKPQLSF